MSRQLGVMKSGRNCFRKMDECIWLKSGVSCGEVLFGKAECLRWCLDHLQCDKSPSYRPVLAFKQVFILSRRDSNSIKGNGFSEILLHSSIRGYSNLLTSKAML